MKIRTIFFLNFKTTHHFELPIGQTQAYKHVFGIPSWLFLVCSLTDSTENKLKPVNFFSHVLDLKPQKNELSVDKKCQILKISSYLYLFFKLS